MELSTVRIADQVGCRVEDLMGTKVACPKEKLGRVIGRKGQHVQKLQGDNQVTLNIDKLGGVDNNPDVVYCRILGSMESLDQTVSDLDRVISITEETVEVPSENIHYWTAKGITALADIRVSHPDVHIDASKKNKNHVKLRGIPEDIASVKQDLLFTTIVEQEWQVPSKDGSLVVGKQGATIENLVVSHQTAIQVERNNDTTDIQVDWS